MRRRWGGDGLDEYTGLGKRGVMGWGMHDVLSSALVLLRAAWKE